MRLSLNLPVDIGQYTLEGQVASGGMATVYHGRKKGTSGFSHTVAIKRMHPHCALDPDFVAMFLDEANLAARIRHPNVVPVLDIVSVSDDLLIVMEFVAGETIARLLRAARELGRRPPHRIVAAIIAGVLEGLHAAHEVLGDDGKPLNIVHRDVSPQNIIVGFDGVSRVLDFGVAKAAVRFQTTRAGQLKGRLQYMAPEQIRSRPVDRRADVYSVSVLFWEMLAGKRLFDGENAGTTMVMVLEGTVPSLRALDPSISPSLEWLILKGLRPDPTDRFSTAREMAVAIDRAVGIATPREVADWVREVVPAKSAQRTASIAGVDLEAFGPKPAPPEFDEPLAPVPAPTPEPVEAPKKKSKKLLLAAFGVTFVLCIVGFWVALHQVPWLGPALISTSRSVFGDRFTAWIERIAHGADAGWSDLRDSDERPEAYWNLPSASASVSSAPPILRFRPADLQPMNSAPFARNDGSWISTDTPVGDQSPHAYRTALHTDVDHAERIARVIAVDRRRTALKFVPGKPTAEDEVPMGVADADRERLLAVIHPPPESTRVGGSALGTVEIAPAAPNLCTVAVLENDILIDHFSNLEGKRDAMLWWKQVPTCLVQSGADTAGLDVTPGRRLVGLGVSANAEVLYLVIGDGMSRSGLARVLRYAGARHAAQMGGVGNSANIYVHAHTDKGSTVAPLAPEMEVDQDLTDFFYLVRTDP